MLFPNINGVGRDAENESCLCLYLARRPSDDEMRRIHDFLNDAYLQSEFEFRGRSPAGRGATLKVVQAEVRSLPAAPIGGPLT